MHDERGNEMDLKKWAGAKTGSPVEKSGVPAKLDFKRERKLY